MPANATNSIWINLSLDMPVALTVDAIGFAEAEKALAGIPKAFPRAAAEAINRGLIAGRKVASQAIRTRYNIKAATLKGQGMALKKASWGKLSGELGSRGSMLPVRSFRLALECAA